MKDKVVAFIAGILPRSVVRAAVQRFLLEVTPAVAPPASIAAGMVASFVKQAFDAWDKK